jgi:hypothetical protein
MTMTPVEETIPAASPHTADLLIKEARQQARWRRLRRIQLALVILVVVVATAITIDRSSPAPVAKTKSSIGSTQVVAAPCSASALRVTDRGSDVGMGSWIQLFQFTNVSAHACSMTGYPKITLETAKGVDTTLKVSDVKGDSIRHIGDTHKGPLPIANLSARGGRSSFWIAGSDTTVRNQPPSSCGFASEVLVTPPGAFAALVHHVGGDRPFTWCENSIQVTPVLSGQSGSIPAEPLCIYDLIGPTTMICKDGAWHLE